MRSTMRSTSSSMTGMVRPHGFVHTGVLAVDARQDVVHRHPLQVVVGRILFGDSIFHSGISKALRRAILRWFPPRRPLRFQRLAQQRLEVGRHAAQQRYGEFRRDNGSGCGTAKVGGTTGRTMLPDLRAVDMRAYERCERGQKAVGVRLAVDAADDLLVIQPVRREKLALSAECAP